MEIHEIDDKFVSQELGDALYFMGRFKDTHAPLGDTSDLTKAILLISAAKHYLDNWRK